MAHPKAGRGTTSAEATSAYSEGVERKRKPTAGAPGAAKLAGTGIGSSLGGAAIGALVMYYSDPQSGRRRRAQFTDQVRHGYNKAQADLDRSARDLSHRVQGIVARGRPERGGDVSDAQLVERVRSLLGRYCSHPHAVEVSCDGGIVDLFGPILTKEKKALLRAVNAVPGVKGLRDQLHAYETGAHIPALQGGLERRGPRPDVMQENWAPATRLVAGALGVGLLGSALRGRGAGSVLSAAVGGTLLTRAAINQPMRRILGLGEERYAVEIQKSIYVEAPVDEVYRYFECLETLPQFMDHIQEVKRIGENRWHWKVSGPAKLTFEWDAESRSVPGEKLSWRSERGASVENAGVMRFEREGSGTRIHIQMTYRPPAGVLGHQIAKWLGADPRHQMDEDLLRFKSLLEQGKATAHGHTVLREEVELSAQGYASPMPS